MKLLVTGSSGYVGSKFIQAHKEQYDFSTFSLEKDHFDTLKLEGVDTILHCAALVHRKSQMDPNEYHRVNVQYPVALAQKAKGNGVKHFIFLSTVAVYGGDQTCLNEETGCFPVSLYAKSKYEAEKQLEALGDEKFTVSIVRLPMVYGHNAPGNISLLLKLVRKSFMLPFGQIHNQRSFLYIGNLVYGINEIVRQRKGGIFLLSDDMPIGTTTLIESIAKAYRKKVYLVHLPLFDALLKKITPSLYQKLFCDLVVDNSKTKKVLSLRNPYTTQEGIQHMIQGEPQ